mgnify:FL=1
MKKYFISFVEEFIFNPKYQDYIAGRVEIYLRKSQYDIDELRFFTKKIKKFHRFRDKWDLEEVSEKQLEKIRKIIEKEFNEVKD